MMRIAIVGGGPGGLLTAYELENSCAGMFEAALFEASPRIGGKIVTRQFQSAPVTYEAGVAEFYSYAHFAPDPVYDLVRTLGLETIEIVGPAVILGDTILNDYTDIRQFGQASLDALENFYKLCEEMLDTDDYYECHWLDDNEHPWSRKTFREILDIIPDEIARKYIEVGVRSDVATEPHLTNALNGLKNILMDEAEYLRTYSIKGGNERLLDALARRLKTTNFVLETAVTHISKTAEGKYHITTRHKGSNKDREFDIVVMAMPNYWLARLGWDSRALRMAMQKHLAAYDNPAHYLRISILFEKPFWRDKVKGSFFMSDTFGGCCIYDEGSWHESGSYGVLAWLLTSNDAMALTNCDDETLLGMVLDSLPAPLAEGRSLFKEGRVQRWVGTINGQPGGRPVKSLRERHIPAPDTHPNLFVVGDYLFDSTVNGTYDSAGFVVDTIQTILRKQKYAYQLDTKITTQTVNEKGAPVLLHKDYYELYDGQRPYEESFEEYFCEHYTTDLIREIWGWSPPYKLLDGGSANGLTLERFESKGIEAWGIEFNPLIHARTAEKWKSRNIFGSVCALPFEDKSFDFIYDTCLCYVPPENLDNAIAEMFRVCRVGVFFGGITSDMTETVIEKHDLFEGVQTLCSLGDWMELFRKQGFRPAVTDIKVLKRIWKIENDANVGGDQWYPSMDAMRCCFYSKPDAPPPPPRPPKQSRKSSFITLEHALVAKPRKHAPAGASAQVAARTGTPNTK